MKKIEISFEKGGSLSAILNEKDSPHTVSAIWNILPFEGIVTQSRWSGREVNFQAKVCETAIRENQTLYTSIGEVCYWRNWRGKDDVEEAIAIYYGAEKARSHIGDEPVNVFGQVDFSELEKLKKIGERIWLEGKEKIKLEKWSEKQ